MSKENQIKRHYAIEIDQSKSFIDIVKKREKDTGGYYRRFVNPDRLMKLAFGLWEKLEYKNVTIFWSSFYDRYIVFYEVVKE